MSTITKVIRFDVAALPSNDIERFQDNLKMFTSLSDISRNSETHKITYIRAFFNSDIDVEQIIKDFNSIEYTDITGTNLMNP
ncbi:MAG: hypothetical protein HDT42_04795 [Ruminococcaceae bacterium]|nr:hypothetical protein [Oscillospiraceae bacterium]